MEIARAGGVRGKVIEEIILPTREERGRIKEAEVFAARIAETVDSETIQRLVVSQLGTITDVLGRPMILDTFETHTTGDFAEETMGRREWRDTLYRSDPQAWEYLELNALRASTAFNAPLNAIAFLNAVAQPVSEEGRAVLLKWSEGADNILGMLTGTREPQEAPPGEDDISRQVREAVSATGVYDSLPDAKKVAIVRLVRQFVYSALKELAPAYELK